MSANMKTLTKQQLRTRETQLRLLDAAEKVFVKDGFEGAQLDAIAAAAGRSKGAVYTHFRNKEDLFLALFESRMRSYIGQLADLLSKCKTSKQRLKAFRGFYVGVVHDKSWSILTLEFKLYALRHPESKKRLRKAFEMSNATSDASMLEQIFGQLTADQKTDNDLSLSSLGPIASALILESHFEPEIFSERATGKVLGRIFDALFSAHS